MSTVLGRRGLVGAALASLVAGLIPSRPAKAAAASNGIPDGYADVDPRTARKVPLTLSLRAGVPVYPGDPSFAFDPAFIDTRGDADAGFLLERITSLGTHTASHISAPAHFIRGAARLDELDEEWTLMPLVVVDLRGRIVDSGRTFRVGVDDLRAWEQKHGRIPEQGCVLLLTGNALLFPLGEGEQSPYVTAAAPGFSGDAVDWLYTQRGITAVGADTLGPDATDDADLQATTRALQHAGITVENVGPGLAEMRPHGDWISINGNRPGFSGFQMGFTGYTVAGSAADRRATEEELRAWLDRLM